MPATQNLLLPRPLQARQESSKCKSAVPLLAARRLGPPPLPHNDPLALSVQKKPNHFFKATTLLSLCETHHWRCVRSLTPQGPVLTHC